MITKATTHTACITDLVDSHKTSSSKSCIYRNEKVEDIFT